MPKKLKSSIFGGRYDGSLSEPQSELGLIGTTYMGGGGVWIEQRIKR